MQTSTYYMPCCIRHHRCIHCNCTCMIILEIEAYLNNLMHAGQVPLAGAVTSIIFVVTKVCLSWQNLCCDKFCRDKHNFVTKYLSWQKFCPSKHAFVAAKDVFCHNSPNAYLLQQKWYLWQLPPMIVQLFLFCTFITVIYTDTVSVTVASCGHWWWWLGWVWCSSLTAQWRSVSDFVLLLLFFNFYTMHQQWDMYIS